LEAHTFIRYEIVDLRGILFGPEADVVPVLNSNGASVGAFVYAVLNPFEFWAYIQTEDRKDSVK
jgi:hypothetical protein